VIYGLLFEFLSKITLLVLLLLLLSC